MSGARSRPDFEERGFILIFAIAVCLMLALVGAVFGRSVQSALRSTNAGIEIAKAAALADGGVVIGGELIRAGAGSVSRICSVAGAGVIALTIEDEDGKVSLNSNNTALHVALFTGLGVSREEAERYADLIADYRDADDAERPKGAEVETYAAAGSPIRPRNSNFETVAELDRVLNIPADVRARAKPFFTAFTSASGVDEEVAPAALVEILKGADSFGSAAFGKRGSLPAALSAVSTRSVYKLRAIGVTTGARYVREKIVARPLEPGQNLRAFSWGQGELSAEDEARLALPDTPPAC